MDMHKSVSLLLIFAICTLISSIASKELVNNYSLVNKPVIDLRSKPVPSECNFEIDILQLTQLLYNEPVIVKYHDENNQWSYIEAINQPNYVNNTWGGYQGWVQTSQLTRVYTLPKYNLAVTNNWAPVYRRRCDPLGCVPTDQVASVSMGTLFQSVGDISSGWWQIILPPSVDFGNFQTGWILGANVAPVPAPALAPLPERERSYLIKTDDTTQLRAKLVETGMKLLGWYYLWGGRSAFNDMLYLNEAQITGLDCSGLVSIIYKTHGITLPRDAAVQFLKSSNATSGAQSLLPGDLLFLAKPSTPNHMFHVMMVADENTIIESSVDDATDTSPATNGTKSIGIKERFGVTLSQMKWGALVPKLGSLIYWGRFIV